MPETSVVKPSKRMYSQTHSIINCYDVSEGIEDREYEGKFLFSIRLPTFFEAEMLMQDLKGDTD